MDSGSFWRTQISSSGCRGTGLSDRQLTGHSPEQRSEDLIAVMDAAGSAEAVLLGWLSGAISLLTAALHPTRVRGVVAGEVLAAGHPDADHPFGVHPEMQRMLAQALETGDWGRAMLARLVTPEIASHPRQLARWSRYESMAATPHAAARLLELNADLDLRPYLARIEAQVLLIQIRVPSLIA
jgi:pimeloyl-ACP methyl ester carboxylesterase